ncbi:unnamed protein product [Calicophoron daubneyi]|uniref:Rap-GAP domain-containing protein n=1 Tax=Calicophoron daubneyi TaxID=300641 RepID=A0AAV2TSG6_CALDB
MDRVFRRHRTSEVSVIKSKKKFLADKDSPQRLKHLRVLINQLPSCDLHAFFNENYSFIFHTFSEAFFLLDNEPKQKVTQAHVKELENALSVFENILLLLPDLISRKWQYNCIVEILEELLNEKNAVSIRKEGIRLFLIWYQILGANATAKCHQMFTNLVPGFGNLIFEYQKRETLCLSSVEDPELRAAVKQNEASVSTVQTGSGNLSGTSRISVTPRELGILLPLAEQPTANIPQILLQHFLKTMVSEVSRVSWSSLIQEHHLMQFWFLFEQFKRTYLPVIFPCLSPLYSIYEPNQLKSLGPDSEMIHELDDYPISFEELSVYQEELVCWLTTYIDTSPRNPCSSSVDGRFSPNYMFGLYPSDAPDARSTETGNLSVSSPPPTISTQSHSDLNQSSGLTSGLRREGDRSDGNSDAPRSSLFEPLGSRTASISIPPAEGGESHRPSVFRAPARLQERAAVPAKDITLVCAVLYGCRQNINLMHDILHHAFLLPIQCYKALFAVVSVYSSWIEDKPSRPVFLQETDISDIVFTQRGNRDAPERYVSSDEKSHDGDDEAEDLVIAGRIDRQNCEPAKSFPISDSVQPTLIGHAIRSDSDSSSVTASIHNDIKNPSKPNTEELRGCLQTSIQLMLENMAKVFLLTCPPSLRTVELDQSGKTSTRTVDYLREQVELCRKILHIFRVAANSNELDPDTWTRLLSILLEVMSSTMIDVSPSDRTNNCWLTCEKLIQALFQTMNVALLRASLFAPISHDPWNQCMAVYSQLTHWPALITEWRKVMQTLTATMAKFVYGVDLSDLPQEKKNRRGKISSGIGSSIRVRPKSFTETAIGYHPSIPNSQPTGLPLPNLGQSGVHATSVDRGLGGKPTINDEESAHGRGSGLSGEIFHAPNNSQDSGRSGDPPYDTTDDSGTLDFAVKNGDAADEEESISLEMNEALGDEEVELGDADTLLKSRANSRTLLPRSLVNSPEHTLKSGTLVPNSHDFPGLRRVASDLDEKMRSRSLLTHSIHDPTFDGLDGLERPAHRPELVNEEKLARLRNFSVSPDSLSALSVGSAVVSHKSHHSIVPDSRDSRSFIQNGPNADPDLALSTSPAGVDDDSFSAASHNDSMANSRASADDSGGRESKPVAKPCNGSYNPDPSEEELLLTNSREPVISPELIRPNSSAIRRDDVVRSIMQPRNSVATIDRTTSKSQLDKSLDQPQDLPLLRCILAGGIACGWTQESVVVCWHRFLGILGNVNKIESTSNLEKVYLYFADLVSVLLKIRAHQIVDPVSDECVRPIPNYVVPIDCLLPTLFEALELRDHPDVVKLSAVRTLSDAIIRTSDGMVNDEVIAQFFRALHRFLSGSEERFVREIVRSCGVRLFSSDLPGSNLLLLDFLKGATLVINDQTSSREIPRLDALMMLICLLCYPYHFGPIESLDPTSKQPVRLKTCDDLKTQLLNLFCKSTQTDPNAEARCVGLTGLATYCIIELVHMDLTSNHRLPSLDARVEDRFIIDSITILLGMMRFHDRPVALVAVEMIHMLADYCDLFLRHTQNVPSLILQSLTWTLRSIWESSSSDKISAIDKRLLIELILAVLEWVIRIPPDLARNPIRQDIPNSESILSEILTVLYMVVCNSSSARTTNSNDGPGIEQSSGSERPDPLKEALSECKFQIDLSAFSATSSRLESSSLAVSSFLMSGFGQSWNSFQSFSDEPFQATQPVRLAARVALCHILNHLDHFPLDSQGAQINTCVQEYHDQSGDPSESATNKDVDERELSVDILEQPNLQLFALNGSILITLLSLPSPQHPVTPSIPPVGEDSAKMNNGKEHAEVPIPSDLVSLRLFAQQPTESDTPKSHTVVSDHQYTRAIIRDFSGRYSFDLSYVYGLWNGVVPPCLVELMSSTNEVKDLDNAHIEGDFGPQQRPDTIRTQRSAPPCPPPRMNPNPPPLAESQNEIKVENTNATSELQSGSPVRLRNESSGDETLASSVKSDRDSYSANSISDTTQQSTLPAPPDLLNELLIEVTSNSPECSITWKPNVSDTSAAESDPNNLNTPCFNMERLTGDQIAAQLQVDDEALNSKRKKPMACSSPESELILSGSDWNTPKTPPTSPTGVCNPAASWATNYAQFLPPRHLINQLGFLSWERRSTIELMHKSAGLVRELKHLDKLSPRETHKIAVFYVGAGQEDKQSILSNQTASLEFENFLAGLGWEIDLLTHRGFRGGLERSSRIGTSTPYYATATLEVIFHVSTRMPSSTQEDLKYKHLGNDEVMIIWTENARAFTRSVLRTQFGDVLIVISPLPNGLFRVDVRRETDVGFFGPLVKTAVLDAFVLPSLVRATAINASRAIRAMKPGYRAHYEDRASSLKQIIARYTMPSCFEDFTQSVLLPGFPTEQVSPRESQFLYPDKDVMSSMRLRDRLQQPSLSIIPPLSAASNIPQVSLSGSRSGPVARVHI